jgi:hypothetical protein
MQLGESDVPDPESIVGDAEVLRALGRLKPKHREILALVGLGFTAAEIAAELGMPETMAARAGRVPAGAHEVAATRLTRYRQTHEKAKRTPYWLSGV